MFSLDKKLLCFFIFIITLHVSAKEGTYSYSRIEISRDSLVFCLKINNLFNESIVEGLQKGMTTVLEYRIQLWKKRSLWFDKLITEDIIRFKISYDIWGKRYVVMRNKLKPEALDIHGVRQVCQQLYEYALLSSQKLKTDKEYFLAVKVRLRPISIENYREIQRWLVGEAKEIDAEVIKEPQKAGEKAGNWFLGMVLNLSGFGDKVINAKSDLFSIHNNKISRQEHSRN